MYFLLGKLYFLPNIHNRLNAVPGRSVISNCGTPTEKVSEYLDYILKPLMQDSCSYIKDFCDFLKKIKNVGKIPDEAILVTADLIGIYPSISHGDGLETLRKRLNKKCSPKVPTEDIVQMADFVLKNNCLEFNGEIKRQKSGTAISAEFAPPYAYIFMDEVETEFPKSKKFQNFLRLSYIDDMFLYELMEKES